MPEVQAPEIVIVGLGIDLLLSTQAQVFLGRQLGLDFVDNVVRHVVLKRHDFAYVLVVGLGPQVAIRMGVQQLRGDSHPVTRAGHAAFNDRVHVQFFCNFRQWLVGTLVMHG